MFQPPSKAQRAWSAFIVLSASLAACLLWQSPPTNQTFRPDDNGPEPASVVNKSRGSADSPPQTQQLSGEQAQRYLQQTSDGKSLMQAVTAERFGLKLEQRDPILGASGAGYLGMSHDQNLNAWFDDKGATIRPTTSEKEQAQAWQLGLHLQAYGYGSRMQAAPPIVAHTVKGTRIEYERTECRLPIANCRFEEKAIPAFSSSQSPSETFSKTRIATSNVLQSTIDNRQSAITEWYENRSEGIEQGFTINTRPARSGEDGTAEPLRVSLGVTGELRARAKGAGQEIDLVSGAGKPVASYSKLTAVDANHQQLAARMEASADGRKINLVVDDQTAAYPIVIDPIVATLQRKLEAFDTQQTDARFGFAVAIEANRAVVGAWREDLVSAADVGFVYTLTRENGIWSVEYRMSGNAANDSCGWSVAISSSRLVYGCPGANTQAGRAVTGDLDAGGFVELMPTVSGAGQFGYSVATSGNAILVGAPFSDFSRGRVHFFGRNNDGTFSLVDIFGGSNPDEQFGTSVAIDSFFNIVAGAPGYQSGRGRVVFILPETPPVNTTLLASDGEAGDNFGNSIDFQGNTLVVGAFGDDDVAADAGAAYVFVRAANGSWSQQQKLTVDDGRAKPGDHFSEHAVAIDGGMIVVGAALWDLAIDGDNAGAAYIFTRNDTVWTLQTALYGDTAENFGISVGISGNTVLVGARASDGSGTPRAGAAYAYLLDCLPAQITNSPGSQTLCEGETFFINFSVRGTGVFQYQWRKNGINIPGATHGSYQIDHVGAADAGNYDVVIANSCGGDISTLATLTVVPLNINPVSQNFSASGSNGIVNVSSTGSCAWTAVSNSSFITISSGSSGSGNGTVGFTVAANATSTQRTGTLTIAGKTFTVTQDAAALPANVVQFSSSAYNVVEDCTTLTITVNRIGDTSSAASVDYSTSDVGATARRDYITALGRLTFAPGETAKTFPVLINEDSYVEGNETFNVNLTNPSGVGLGTSVATVTITDDATEPATNAIDDPQCFVCQHYHDFLNRAPDASGLAFWTNEITSCGANQACIELKRINVSAAYFLSIEFQQTGYLVERLYKTAYGNANGNSTFGGTHQLGVPIVRLNEFLPDTQNIGKGVVVGQTGWETVLENNKQAFIAGFVQQSRFSTAFPASLTPAQFVDTLNANAGNPLSSAERNQLVNDLATSAKTRAQVLRAVAEDPDLVNGESNRAFVLMQFFGYLRRNPNDPQDSDYTGYDFWLTKLNQFSGNFQNAEMVKAFITSGEYRQRFGP